MMLRKVGFELRRLPGRGFTLVELLVVILIILAVSAVALPTVIPAISHRQVSEAARLLQASLAGARDAAIHANAPRGIRLLPDPGFFTAVSPTTGQPALPRLANGRLDPASILAANRIIPIEAAPDYSEGRLEYYSPFGAVPQHTWNVGNPPPYPGPQGTAPYNWYPVAGFNPSWTDPQGQIHNPNVLCVVESALDPTTFLPHSPTSWFWNIRLGDKIRIADSTTYFTVVGPMTVHAGNGNPELFVNDGPPGSVSQLTRTYSNGTTLPVEYLFLVNGTDDDNNGFADDGWDGVNNNQLFGIDDLDEWERETWLPPPAALRSNQTYTIRRRPVPSLNTKEVAPSEFMLNGDSNDDGQGQSKGQPFGGGSGGGVSITPIAFLVVNSNGVKMIHLDESTHLYEKILDLAPQAVDKIQQMFNQKSNNNSSQNQQNQNSNPQDV